MKRNAKQRIIQMLNSIRLIVFFDRFYRKYVYLSRRKDRLRNIRFKEEGAPDGLPLPFPHLVYLITRYYDLEKFYSGGVVGSKYIKSSLEKNGLNINAFESILDFGCGCGRIMRNWKTLAGPKLYGVDINQLLIAWCQKALPFAEFKTNQLSSQLDFEDNKFDFIYAISVFTHLTQDLQHFWMNELKRVLKPNGVLLLTVRTALSDCHPFSSEDETRFNSGELIIQYNKYVGTNFCNVFHPLQYVREVLCKDFLILDIAHKGAEDYQQDIILLKKKKRINH